MTRRDDDPGEAVIELTRIVHQLIENPKGRYRCEDLISAAAAFAGETSLRRSGEIDMDGHEFAAGASIFSQRINAVLSGDRTEWGSIPESSAFGRIFRMLTRHPDAPWLVESFPDVSDLYRRFAESRRNGVTPDNWGKAALSVPQRDFPVIAPLRAAYEIRRHVLARWPRDLLGADVLSLIAQTALMRILATVHAHIEERIALALALETMNAMAKSTPILPRHMAEWARQSRSA